MSTLYERRERSRRKSKSRPTGPITLTLRKMTPLRRDTRVRYPDGMVDRVVDRATWAQIVRDLMAQEAGSNRRRFASLIQVDYKTVGRWLKEEVDVSEKNVRAVADALHISPIDLLIRVGYYHASDLTPVTLPSKDEAQKDPALQAILEADFPPRIKLRMIKRLEELRDAQAVREVDEVRFWLDQAQGA